MPEINTTSQTPSLQAKFAELIREAVADDAAHAAKHEDCHFRHCEETGKDCPEPTRNDITVEIPLAAYIERDLAGEKGCGRDLDRLLEDAQAAIREQLGYDVDLDEDRIHLDIDPAAWSEVQAQYMGETTHEHWLEVGLDSVLAEITTEAARVYEVTTSFGEDELSGGHGY